MNSTDVDLGFEDADSQRLRIVDASVFVAGVDEGAEPLLLGPGGVALPAGGLAIEYGDPGSGKTTREVDLAVHAAAGRTWLGLLPARPLNVLIVEGEGPRQPFREKLGRRLAAWPDPLEGSISVLEDPWARVSLADSSQRTEIAASIRDREIDLLMIGPLKAIGASGVGSPDDVADFRNILSDLRRLAGRPFGIWLVHHTNKAGAMAGGWAGETDLTIHVKAESGSRDRHALTFEKARWDSDLHGRKWIVGWGDNASFVLLDDGSEGALEARAAKQQADESAALEWLRSHVSAHPGIAPTAAETAYDLIPESKRPSTREALRRVVKRLKAESAVGRFTDPAVVPGGKKGHYKLIPASQANPQPADTTTADSAGTLPTLLGLGNPHPAAPSIEGGGSQGGGGFIDDEELERLNAKHADLSGAAQ